MPIIEMNSFGAMPLVWNVAASTMRPAEIWGLRTVGAIFATKPWLQQRLSLEVVWNAPAVVIEIRAGVIAGEIDVAGKVARQPGWVGGIEATGYDARREQEVDAHWVELCDDYPHEPNTYCRTGISAMG